MKKQRKTACLILALLLMLSFSTVAFADFVFSDDDDQLNGEYDATVFLAGENPMYSGKADGILFAAGKTVSSGGESEYAFLAGNDLNFSGTVSRDAFIAGNSITFTGSCERDMAAAGNIVEIRGTVGRDLAVGAKTIIISGHVGGNVYLSAQTITITDEAEIEGTIRYNSGASVSAPAETLAGATVYEDEASSEEGNGQSSGNATGASSKSSSIVSKVRSGAFSFVGLLLVALCVLWLTPLWEKLDAAFAGKGFGFYVVTFFIGLAVLICLPIVCVVLLITVVGARLSTVLLLIYAAVLVASPVFFGFFIGSLLWRKAFGQKTRYWAELTIGLLLWCVLAALPYASVAIRLIFLPFGLGVITRLLGKKHRTPDTTPRLPAG